MAMNYQWKWNRNQRDVDGNFKEGFFDNSTKFFSRDTTGDTNAGDKQLADDDDVPYEEEDRGFFAHLSRGRSVVVGGPGIDWVDDIPQHIRVRILALDTGKHRCSWRSCQTPATYCTPANDRTAVTLGIVCGCAAAAVLVCIVVLLWFRSRRRRQKLLNDLTSEFGSDESKSTKSAPASRNASPKLNKRMSCPDALAVSRGGRSLVVRSLASDRIPDFALPPERVQPSMADKRGPTNISMPHSSSFGSLAPDLYQQQSYSEEDETGLPETTHGRLWFSVVHDPATERLHVTLVKIKDLPGRTNTRHPRDPFVKIFLLPDERTHRVSKVKKKTLSPVFNEIHSFQVSAEDVKKRTLKFSVYDVDKRRVRHSLGHVKVTLKSMDLAKGEVMWSELEPMVQPVSSLGELQFSLVFIPSNDKIKVGIHRAKNLTFVEDYPDMGVYVRVQLHFGHRCHRIKRTIARQGQSDMTFNESVSFSVASKQMDSCSLVISLMLTSSHLYSATEVEHGRVVVGSFMYARGEELVHWQEMMSQPKMATTRWHCLKNVTPSP